MLNSENNKNSIVIEGLFQYSLFIKLISFVVLDLHELFGKGRTFKCIWDLGADERVFGSKLK
jgi:hypothetical protein